MDRGGTLIEASGDVTALAEENTCRSSLGSVSLGIGGSGSPKDLLYWDKMEKLPKKEEREDGARSFARSFPDQTESVDALLATYSTHGLLNRKENPGPFYLSARASQKPGLKRASTKTFSSFSKPK